MRSRFLAVFMAVITLPVGAADQLTLFPSFENCSYYYNYSAGVSVDKCWNTADVFKLSFKVAGSPTWEEAFHAVWDNYAKQFRGSIFYLAENTEYDVKVEMNTSGRWVSVGETTFRTWNSDPGLKSTLNLGSLAAYRENRAITLSNMKGAEDSYIKVIGNVPVHAGTTSDNAILVDNCEYLILEGFTVTGGRLNGVKINDNCKNIRIIGADISRWGRIPVDQVDLSDPVHYPEAKYKDYDAVYLDELGELIRNDAGICMVTTSNDASRPRSDLVVERCYIHDQNGYCNPWYGTRTLGYSAGKEFRYLHPQGPQGIYIRNSGGLVVRYNDIVGSDTKRLHDLSGSMDNGKTLGGYYRDADIYGNFLAFAQDDGIELDGSQMNLRFYNNRIEQVRCGVSTAPNLAGPSYLIGNVIHHVGDSEGDNGAAIKNGGGTTYSLGLTYFFNNTMIVPASCIAAVGYGSDSNQGMFQGYSRNNILVCTVPNNQYGGNCIHDPYNHPNSSFDYDLLANTTRTNMEGVAYTVAGKEANAVKGNPQFTDRDNGVYTLESTSPAIGAGISQANVSTTANGDRPDMGAFAFGESSLYPKRPLAAESDKYLVKINPQGDAVVQINIGSIPEELTYTVTKNEDMDWLNVSPAAGSVAQESSFRLRLTADASDSKVRKGVVFVRFSNGCSIPVSIFTDVSAPMSIADVKRNDPVFYAVDKQLLGHPECAGTLHVYDITGRLVYQGFHEAGKLSLPLVASEGVYIVAFRPVKGKNVIQKIIIQQ
ncbi:MAG: T9SS type A sorting domain-containing protein [Candidatus Azobacteroides sp.]|nr:T9SS type A sorting domain-containing protein [Candidatus Azobacteroides sp.]